MSESQYSIYRTRIFDEYTLIGHRLGWMLAAQSMLLTAFAIVAASARANDQLLSIISIFGLLVAIGSLVSAVAAIAEIEGLQKTYRSNTDQAERAKWPSLVGGGVRHVTGHVTAIVLPVLMIGLWIAVRSYVSPWV